MHFGESEAPQCPPIRDCQKSASTRRAGGEASVSNLSGGAARRGHGARNFFTLILRGLAEIAKVDFGLAIFGPPRAARRAVQGVVVVLGEARALPGERFAA